MGKFDASSVWNATYVGTGRALRVWGSNGWLYRPGGERLKGLI
jgi:hypothetical protein